MKDTALAAAKEMIKTMEGLADGLQERLRRTEAENEALRKELEKYREEERKMTEEVFRGGSGEFSGCDDGETLEDLSGKLSCYYRDLDLYDEKRITAEDGETLYHTMKYIFKQLKKAGVRFK
ncbi:hypothetical protein [Dialister invisus]|jgi:chromosome segregation ATPase|uniref:hypothetical protein n=1 Tax=Dialister invisus TaxID=218538 RepID=UPI00288032AB|nr:hypothetical protein [Dialister invisus]